MKKIAISTIAGAALALFLAIPASAGNKSAQHRWPAETLGGTIGTVEPGRYLIVVETPDNVPFDIVITPKTRIMNHNQAVPLENLSRYKDSHVTVDFIPEGRGDVAESIRING